MRDIFSAFPSNFRAMSKDDLDPYKVAIGRRVRLTRLALGYGQNEIAKKYGIAQSRWSMWEAGANEPPTSLMGLWAEDEGFSLDWIYSGKRNRLPSELREEIERREREPDTDEPSRASREKQKDAK
jgi:transcriptional regulator with XRE-family HTH domain